MVTPIKFIDRLSVKLTRYSVLLAFGIGVLLSLLQVLFDFFEQEEFIDASVHQVLNVATPPASRAVETLDKSLAQEMITGLEQYEYISKAVIYDDLSNVLAISERDFSTSKTLWLTQSLTGKEKEYEVQLAIQHYSEDEKGRLVITVNMDEALNSFYDRSFNVLVSGVLRNFLLLMALLYLYLKLLTKPLEYLAVQFANLRPSSGSKKRLQIPSTHRRNELGLLADTGNQYIDLVSELLKDNEIQSEALRASEGRLNRLIQELPQLVFAIDNDDNIIFANQPFCDIYGVSLEEVNNSTLPSLHAHSLAELHTIQQFRKQIFQDRQPAHIEDLVLTDNEEQKSNYSVQMRFMDYLERDAVLVVATNINEQKAIQNEISRLANEDSLTGLPNRNLLLHRLQLKMEQVEAESQSASLLFIDLDHFKNINDSLGHDVGDHLLQLVAIKLEQILSEKDLIARFGGDEFVVLLDTTHKDMEALITTTSQICERILHAIDEPFHIEERTLHIGMSIGIATYPYAHANIKDLLRFADIAMYKAKASGRNCYRYYEGSMATEVEELHDLESELHQAYTEQQFELYYQPQVNAQGQLLGLEALIRWNHPTRGVVGPNEFIPILESNGQIVSVSNWVLTQTCQQIKAWREKGLWKDDMYVAVNISAYQFYLPGFVEHTRFVIQEQGVPLHQICLEVTENVAIESMSFAARRLLELREIGLKVALDDFGTGYSSLAYLKDLPIDILKIDRSFVKDIATEYKQEVIIEAILAMAIGLNMEVVAEGVETDSHLAFLAERGCCRYQGYLFCKPVSAEEIENQYLLAS